MKMTIKMMSMMLQILVVLLLLTASSTQWKKHTRCEERLDIISPSAWPALPDDYFGRDLRAEAELVSTEFVHGATHSALHTVGGDSFLRDGYDITRELVEIRGHKVKDIRFGIGSVDAAGHMVILMADGSIWTMGRNHRGQLASGDTKDRNLLGQVQGLPLVGSITVGHNFCLALTRDGQLYSWGDNDHMELGYVTTSYNNPTPRPIPLSPEMMPVQSACCGHDHCALLTGNLKVFTWGESGHIGRPEGDSVLGPVVGIPQDETITKLTCGAYHTVVLTTSGKLYGWGWNGHQGRLLQVPSMEPHAHELDLSGRVVRDVLASRHTTVVRTYSPFAEYFGRYDGVIHYSIQMASGIVHGRDVLAKEYRGQQSWGAVRLGCKSNGV